MQAFQDQIPNNHCFGCGPLNNSGLQIKSFWVGEGRSICRFTPEPHHAAGPLHYVNGGIIATIIDCHCVCTACAYAYQSAGRKIGEGETIWFVTGKLEVDYKLPVKMGHEIELQATVEESHERKTIVSCMLYSEKAVCAIARVVTVRVPKEWLASTDINK